MRQAVMKVLEQYTQDELRKVFKIASSCDFLCGRVKNGWRASFDWLIKPENAAKVINGNYSPRREEAKVRLSTEHDDQPWNVEEVNRYQEHPLWDEYYDTQERELGLHGKKWPRFLTYLADNGYDLPDNLE